MSTRHGGMGEDGAVLAYDDLVKTGSEDKTFDSRPDSSHSSLWEERANMHGNSMSGNVHVRLREKGGGIKTLLYGWAWNGKH